VGGDTIMMLLFLRHFVGKKWLGTEREREREREREEGLGDQNSLENSRF